MIEFINVTKTFNNGVKALDNVNMSIKPGEFVAIIGLSGAGKSTLLRSINRLHDINHGKVIVNGKDIQLLEGRALRNFRRTVGMVFQQFNLVKRHTVLKNVLTGRLGYYSNWRSLFGLFSQADYKKVDDALERVGLLDKKKIRSDQLSGGQQQRVSIARTIVQEADIILADEPVSALDPITAQTVMTDFQTLNQELGKTVLINIHSVELARQYATRIIGMRDGKIVFDGPTHAATDQALNEIYGSEIFKSDLMQSTSIPTDLSLQQEEAIH